MIPALLSRKALEDENGCWIWQGAQVGTYGYWRHTTAHRAVYSALVGEIPTDMTLDHLCRVRLCVNPAHLEPVTQGDNIRRGLHVALRTHCGSGRHLWVPENIGPANPSTRTRRRYCRLCANERVLRRYYAGKQAA